ncbi:MAG: deoxyribodipyrimidine photo-lyase, partial [Pseudomonadota bacterium]
MATPPVIWWVRRDLRLAENPALTAAIATGQPVIPVFLNDEGVAALGAAPAWRLDQGLEHFATRLSDVGSRLILRKGPAKATLEKLLQETGATEVHWNRLYDPVAKDRDTEVKSALKTAGVVAVSHHAHVINEPWTVETGQGGYYRVYTPFWRAVRDRDVAEPEAAPSRIPAPDAWPASDELADWALGSAVGRGANVLARHSLLGERAAADRLAEFMAGPVSGYADDRNRLDLDGCSRLSEPLTYGEIGPRTAWHAGQDAMQRGAPGAETWLKELIWRDFAHHLVFHTPHITTANWRPEWDDFPWRDDRSTKDARDWQRGRTGVEVVDAAMREMYVTGRMHNRARMLVASYLTKHLMIHWKVGHDWFADCLVDFDPASNAMGWQWTAG